MVKQSYAECTQRDLWRGVCFRQTLTASVTVPMALALNLFLHAVCSCVHAHWGGNDKDWWGLVVVCRNTQSRKFGLKTKLWMPHEDPCLHKPAIEQFVVNQAPPFSISWTNTPQYPLRRTHCSSGRNDPPPSASQVNLKLDTRAGLARFSDHTLLEFVAHCSLIIDASQNIHWVNHNALVLWETLMQNNAVLCCRYSTLTCILHALH